MFFAPVSLTSQKAVSVCNSSLTDLPRAIVAVLAINTVDTVVAILAVITRLTWSASSAMTYFGGAGLGVCANSCRSFCSRRSQCNCCSSYCPIGPPQPLGLPCWKVLQCSEYRGRVDELSCDRLLSWTLSMRDLYRFWGTLVRATATAFLGRSRASKYKD